MLVFYPILAVVLIALFANAWRLDRRAKKNGKVLVAVRTGFGRRTQFVAVDRADREDAIVAAKLAAMEKKRADLRLGPDNGGYMKAGDFFGGIFGLGLNKERRRPRGPGGY